MLTRQLTATYETQSVGAGDCSCHVRGGVRDLGVIDEFWATDVTGISEVAAVMIHVPDPAAGISWYERAFPRSRRAATANGSFSFLVVGTIQLEIVVADAKVSAGSSGSVVYWRVENLAEALGHFQGLGAQLYRGPLQIEGGEAMCQVRDPWGNCIGLRGPSR